MPGDLWSLDAAELHEAYTRGQASPVEVLDACLGRIAEVDPTIGAFTSLTDESARAEAEVAADELARGVRRGPLHGIPVALKDLFDVRGAVVAYGSPVFDGRVATHDAHLVTKLRAAGALIVGVTRAHEFAWGLTTQHATMGSTRNPWNTDRVPGGSSGGSAAAVATGMVPLALGSDTGGSVRVPAAYCGVMGLKPTYGRLSQAGALRLSRSLDHPGVFARTVDGLARGLEVLAGDDPEDLSTHPDSAWEPIDLDAAVSGVRLGRVPDLHGMRLAPDHEAAFQHAVAAAESAFGEADEVAFPEPEAILPAWAVIQQAEAYDTHTRILGTWPGQADDYGADVRPLMERAADVGIGDYLAASDEAQRVRRRFEAVFRSVDVLLTPVTAGPPSTCADPGNVEHHGEVIRFRRLVLGYTVPQNLAGLPSCAVPVGVDDVGVPVAVQVTAPWGREDLALGVARRLEQLLPPPRWTAPQA